MMLEPSEELKLGRRALEELNGVTLIEDLQWSENQKVWYLHYKIAVNNSSDLIPEETHWYILVDKNYPWGNIKLYPAKKGGIENTFPHQQYNLEGDPNLPWQTGCLCIDTPMHVLGKMTFDEQPYTPVGRLKWHVERAIEWIDAGIRNELFLKDEPFELPQLPTLNNSVVIGFNEDEETFKQWGKIREQSGIFKLSALNNNALFIKSFFTTYGKKLLSVTWGEQINQLEEDITGIWIRAHSVPILQPWQAPMTWEELEIAFKRQNLDLHKLIETTSSNIRDNERHIALIGFPIPINNGEKNCRMHWQGLYLPILSSLKNSKGFRNREESYKSRDRNHVLNGTKGLEWIDANNWNMEEINTRGKLPLELNSKKILIIGAGALGSILATMLARGGATKLIIIDPELMEMGNMVRHTLSMRNIRNSKAKALVKELNLVSPHMSALAIHGHFPPRENNEVETIKEVDIVIDTTGNDALIHGLQEFEWGNPKIFASFSFGFNAKNFYCYGAYGNSFPEENFFNRINPLLEEDKSRFEKSGQPMPREGIGCWHPIFPARIDDLYLLVPTAIKFLEELNLKPPDPPLLSVFTQFYEDSKLTGINRINK